MRKSHFPSLRVLSLTQVLIAVLVVLLLTVYWGMSPIRLARAMAQERAMWAASQAGSVQRWMLEAARQQLQAVSGMDLLLDSDKTKRSAFFQQHQQSQILISDLGIADLQGQVLDSSKSISLANEEWFQCVLKTKKPAEGKYQLSPLSQEPMLPLAVPVFNKNGELVAVVFAGLNFSWLREVAFDGEFPEGATLMLLGGDGKLLFSFPQSKEQLPEELRQWAQTRAEPDTCHRKKEFYGCAPLLSSGKNVAGWIVVGFRETSFLEQIQHNSRIQVCAFLLMAELLLLFIGIFRFVVRPIRKLSETIHQFILGNFHARVEPLDSAKDLDELGQSFNKTAEALQQKNSSLELSEKRFRQVVENSPDAIFIESTDGIVLNVNPAACALHGLQREQLIGKHITDLFPEEHREQVRRDFSRMVSGETTNFESFRYTASGKVVPVQISVAHIDYEGKPSSLLLYIRDISSRKQFEVDLVESEARFGNLSEATFEGVALIDDGSILDANIRLIEMTGYRFIELIGRSFTDLAVPSARLLLAEHLKVGSSKPIEYMAQRKDGTTFPAEARSRALTYKGKLVHLTAIRDMTEQKQATERMKHLVAAVEQTVEGVVVTDVAGIIIYVNPAFERITGYTRDEVIGANPRIFKSGKHDKEFYTDLWETIGRGSVWRGICFNRKKDGTIYQEEQTITPIKDTQGRITHFVSVKHDVTRQVALELQLLQAQKMEAIGRLAGGIAHDFNNILTAVTGYGELSLRRLQPTDALYRHIQEILKASSRATNLTRQLLTFSRKQVLEPQILNLNELIANLQDMLHRLISANVEFVTNLEPRSPWHIKTNPGQIEQVIVNMVVNSHDAMPDGGKLTISTRNITVEKDFAELHIGVPLGDCVLLSISDTGAGMTDETKTRIFEPFFTTKSREKGTGLGLATCYGIVKQTGGHIVVTSKLGEGTTFDIFFPRTREDADDASSLGIPNGSIKDIPRSRGNEVVFVVEDEDPLRELLRIIMTELGYTVWTARNGVDALRLINEKSPHRMDILFTDVIMPKMGGRELAERLRAQDPNLKVIFCTGYTTEVNWINSILSPITQCVQKPFTSLTLGRTLREVLDGKPKS